MPELAGLLLRVSALTTLCTATSIPPSSERVAIPESTRPRARPLLGDPKPPVGPPSADRSPPGPRTLRRPAVLRRGGRTQRGQGEKASCGTTPPHPHATPPRT